jgi:dual specificity phosphatase 12
LFSSILEKRRFVRPNAGFEAQLRLYATMGWKIDPKNTEYKYFRLSIASDKMRKGNEFIITENFAVVQVIEY